LEGWPSKNETDICIGFPRMCTTENMTNMRNETKGASQNTAIYHHLELMKHSKMIPGINSQISFLKLPPISIHDAIIAFAHHCEVTSATLSSLAMVFSETKKWEKTGGAQRFRILDVTGYM